jgi:DNA-directed RNA polymerase sigma subunit (sigma70/sigma32)
VSLQDNLELAEFRDFVFSKLGPDELHVIRLLYGLDGGDRCSVSKVALILDRTSEAIRQKRERALRRLRHYGIELKKRQDGSFCLASKFRRQE